MSTTNDTNTGVNMSTEKNATAILADTKACGFHFSTEVVHDHGKPFAAEIVVVDELAPFEATFPGAALKSCNGSSVRVGSQEVSSNARGMKSKDELRLSNVNWLLGIEEATTVTKVVYRVKIDGEWMEFDSQEEADQAEAELQTA